VVSAVDLARQRWRRGVKPGERHTLEFDPTGRLSGGLQSLLHMELNQNGQQLDPSPSGMRDFVNRNQTFTLTGAGKSQIVVASANGGYATKTGGQTNDQINLGTVFTTFNEWTLSALITWDGAATGTYAGNTVLVANAALTHYFGINGSTNLFTNSTGATWTGHTAIGNYVGPKRLTVTSSLANTATKLFIDGIQNGATDTGDAAMDLEIMLSGWPWPVSDFFWWNRVLSAQEVAEHAADPYGTTMRPRSALNVKGNVAAGGKKPGLLLLGVGP